MAIIKAPSTHQLSRKYILFRIRNHLRSYQEIYSSKTMHILFLLAILLTRCLTFPQNVIFTYPRGATGQDYPNRISLPLIVKHGTQDTAKVTPPMSSHLYMANYGPSSSNPASSIMISQTRNRWTFLIHFLRQEHSILHTVAIWWYLGDTTRILRKSIIRKIYVTPSSTVRTYED